MRRAAICLVVLIAGTAAAGEREVSPRRAAAEIKQALSAAAAIELLRLEAVEFPTEPAAGVAAFRGYPILGSVTVTDEASRRKLIDGITKSIARSELRMVACFFPRHAVRARVGDETIELLICFECATVYVFRSGNEQRLNIDEEPEAFLNGLLDAPSKGQVLGPSAQHPAPSAPQ